MRVLGFCAIFAGASSDSEIHFCLLLALVIMIGLVNQTIKLKHFTNHSALVDIDSSNKAMRSSSTGRICFFAKPILDSPKGRRYV
jgi:hypothetical protein